MEITEVFATVVDDTHMATQDPEADAAAPDAYEELLERNRRLTNLGYARMYLNWDQQVMMPEGGAPGRAQQLSALSATSHELLVDDSAESCCALPGAPPSGIITCWSQFRYILA